MWIAEAVILAHTCTSYLEDDNLHKLAMVYGADRSSCQSHMSTLPEREQEACELPQTLRTVTLRRCVVASLRRCAASSRHHLLR